MDRNDGIDPTDIVPGYRLLLRGVVLGWVLAFLLACWAAVHGGTVTGTVVLPSGNYYTNTIRFHPVSTPTADAGVLVGTGDTLVTPTATNGQFSVTLAAGRYDVSLIGTRGFTIEIPAGSDTNAISELVYYGAASWNVLKLNPSTYEVYWPEGFWDANTNAMVTALADFFAGGTGGGTGSVVNATALTNATFIIGAGGDSLRSTNAAGAQAILGIPAAGGGGYALTSDGAGGFIWASVTNISTLTEVQLYNNDESVWNVITVVGTGSARTMQIESGGSGEGGAYRLIIWNADSASWTTVKAAGSGTERGLTFEE